MIRKTVCGVLTACIAISASPSRASDLYLAGASKGVSADYAFLGAIIPVFSSGSGSGPAVRLWGDFLEYNYTAGGGAKINAAGWGGALAGVYQFSGNWGWTNLSAGVNYRDTVLSANDPGNEQRGSHGYFAAQADGGFNLGDTWRLTGLGSYTPTTHGYLVQAGLDRSVLTKLRLGLSAQFLGDKNYKQESAGVTATIEFTPEILLTPAVGFSKSGGNSGAYGGLTLVLIAN